MIAEAAVAHLEGRLEGVAPSLVAQLVVRTPQEHEQDAGPALAALKATRATTMLVPRECGGRGASAIDAVRFQRALGALAPSAAIATTMHHYKIAALGGVARSGDAHARLILEDLAVGAKLMASGGAESIPGRDLRTLGSWAVRNDDGYRVTGLKRPCSLSAQMDVMSLMVELRAPDGTPEGFAQAFVAADGEGLSREPFWESPVFLAAQSHAVRLDAVQTPADRVFPLRGEVGLRFATDCYAWFQLLIAASYLGVASCVADATVPARRAATRGWSDAAAGLRELEDGLIEAALCFDEGGSAVDRLNLAVSARDRIEDEIGVLGGRLLRAAGGAAFAKTGFYTTLTGALNAIAFHPPQRGARDGVGLEGLDSALREAT